MTTFHALTVADIAPVADGAVSVTFAVPDELREQYRYAPGQHITLRRMVDGVEIRRPYSICSSASAQRLRIGVRQVPGGLMSTYLNQHLRVGELVDVMPPSGRFTVPLDARHRKTYAFFAAGSGITPILSNLATVLDAEPHSQCLVCFGNQTVARTMFADELLALKNRYMTRLELCFFLSREFQDIPLFNGRLDGAKVKALVPTVLGGRHFDDCFVCGPGEMIDEVSAALVGAGVVDAGHVHAERFVAGARPESIAAAVAVAQAAEASGAPQATVTVVMDGRTRLFRMPQAGEMLLDAGLRQGLNLPYSCKAGACATCRCRVTEGAARMVVNHSLERWEVEAGYVLTCQSVPTTDTITLDYDVR